MTRAGKMALDAKPDDLNLSHGMHKVEGEDGLLKVVL